MPSFATERINQFDLTGIGGGETGVKIQDASEDRDRHTGYDDGRLGGTEPYDEKRGECRLWKAVQNNQIWLKNFRSPAAEPEEDRNQYAE